MKIGMTARGYKSAILQGTTAALAMVVWLFVAMPIYHLIVAPMLHHDLTKSVFDLFVTYALCYAGAYLVVRKLAKKGAETCR